MNAGPIAHGSGTLASEGDRLRPALELATTIGLLEAELWHLRANGPSWVNILIYGAVVAIFLISDHRRRKARIAAIDPVIGWPRAWAEALVACAGLSASMVIAATFVGDSNETFEFIFLNKPPIKLANWMVGKFGAALLQQLALQLFLAPLCFELTRSRMASAVLAATIFGLIHLPSPTLVAITILGGFVWVRLYQRSGRLAPLIFCHMVLATMAHGVLPERLTFDMRVGSTAMADLKRFDELKDPRTRLINRRLKENRADLKHFGAPEYYQAQGGNLPGFIQGLYHDVLDRPASPEDLAYWLDRFKTNPREDIASIFLGSDEYALVKEKRRIAAANPVPRR